jgi:hypothetical protein
VTLRIFGGVHLPRRSVRVREAGSEPVERLRWKRPVGHAARTTDDLAWFTDTAAGAGPDLDADPPWLEWRAPGS